MSPPPLLLASLLWLGFGVLPTLIITPPLFLLLLFFPPLPPVLPYLHCPALVFSCLLFCRKEQLQQCRLVVIGFATDPSPILSSFCQSLSLQCHDQSLVVVYLGGRGGASTMMLSLLVLALTRFPSPFSFSFAPPTDAAVVNFVVAFVDY